MEKWIIETNNKETRQIFEKNWEYNEAVISYLLTSRKLVIRLEEKYCIIF
jgi:hypothetical protein